MKSHILLLLILCLGLLSSCHKREEKPERKASMGSIFEKQPPSDSLIYDLASILKGGELIITTISSPETYYDYHGMGMGLQYALVENFCEEQGITIRVEVAKDSVELVQKMLDGEADLLAYPLSEAYLKEKGLVPTGYNKKGRWAVRPAAKKLAEALDDWYGDGIEIDVNKLLEERTKKAHHVDRKAQAVYLSRSQGVISVYDDLFKDAAHVVGWDWRLIASMCYQESAFDPNARSYVGAQGLMQLMPKTAESLGLQPEDICNPEKNVRAAARYLVQLIKQFPDVKSNEERVKFVLASYNGGSGHVRDAMALAKKYGHNPGVWDDVSPYILGLSQPQYYKDPVVKRGYMVGRETANYVYKIMDRWRDYGGNVAVSAPPRMPSDAYAPADPSDVARRIQDPPRRSNRYSSGSRVMRPDDPRFNQMDQ